MSKKRRSIANRFDYYTKRNGVVVVRHKLGKKDKTTYALDKFCKSIDCNNLTSQLELMNTRYKQEYKQLTTEERRYKRVLLRIVRDWRDYKLTFNTLQTDILLDSIDMDMGVIEATDNLTGERMIYTTAFNEEESSVMVRDNEGNIIEVYEETTPETKHISNKERYKDFKY